MAYTIRDIEQITEFKSWTDRKKIDELLRIDCKQYTKLGITSTNKEKEEVKKNSKKIYRLIKKIDHKIGSDFLTAMD